MHVLRTWYIAVSPYYSKLCGQAVYFDNINYYILNRQDCNSFPGRSSRSHYADCATGGEQGDDIHRHQIGSLEVDQSIVITGIFTGRRVCTAIDILRVLFLAFRFAAPAVEGFAPSMID